jgi:hypothetical protein
MFEKIIAALVAAGIRFVVVGGVAGVAHGSVRLTNDIDTCYDTAADNVRALAALLAEWGGHIYAVSNRVCRSSWTSALCARRPR